MSMVATNDGVGLHVFDGGKRDGPTVVLVAGYGASATSWSLQRDALKDSFRVIMIDRRCHGRSEKVAHGQRVARHGADLANVFEALELDDVLLVGSSMGASTSLAYLDLFGSARLRGVVLVDQTPKMLNEDGWDLGYYGLDRQSLDSFISTFPPPDANPFHTLPAPDALALMSDGTQFSIDDTRALLRNHAEADWRDVVARIEVPLTAMAGRHSPLWPCESSEWMAQTAPLGRSVVLEGSGHVPFLEDPEAFNAALLVAARA